MTSLVAPLEAAVSAAVLAPSSHNTQPWRFATEGPVVSLFADPARALPVNDPDGRELAISCGAALLTLRVAAAHERLDTRVELLPEGPSSDLLARVSVAPGPGDRELAPLYAGVSVRRTLRDAFADAPVDGYVLGRMVTATRAEGARLTVLDDDARHDAAELVERADRAQFGDRRWRRELASWMRSGRSGDGLRVAPLAVPATRLAVGLVDMGRRTGTKDAALLRSAPAVAVLSTAADDRASWLRAGQALQRALLVAAQEGVAAGYLNQPCQVGGELRERLAEVSGLPDRHPQLVLRLGHPARTPPPSPRRPLQDVLSPGPAVPHQRGGSAGAAVGDG